MNINWDGQKAKVKLLIEATGTNIYWLQRIESGSNVFDTSSSVNYGYGDRTEYYVSGSAKGIISHVTANDVITLIGYYEDDLDRIFVDPDLDIHNWDQIILSGSSIKYLCLPLHIYPVGANGITVSKSMLIKRLFPVSGSNNT